jgi:rhamnopyranosyl-N-acetylglucosaminyl-diphospho-decaprenol beta-1,3/1,4-galactofuranosyltransferase
MRVLAHIHTMNDADVVEQLLEALRRQTRPPEAILVVDNASTDGTLNRTFPENVTIIRNPENLGTSGTVRIGLAHGLEHGFHWVWLFDADSVPEPDVLEKLLTFFESLPAANRQQVCFLAARPLTATGEIKEQPISLEREEMEFVPIESAEGVSECDCVLWSGSLYRTEAVAQIGLPSADYVLDIAELEYGYRARQLGFTSYVVHNSVIHHDVGRVAGAAHRVVFRLGSLNLKFHEISPRRCYYSVRNLIYFWLYQYKPRRINVALRAIARTFVFTFGFAVRPISHGPQLVACLRGIRDGLTGHMERRC